MTFLIPSTLTFLNLAAGCAAIVSACGGHIERSCFLVLCGALCDAFDGWSARTFDCETAFGKTFDSVADFFTFGVAPAVIALNAPFLKGHWEVLSCAVMFAFCSGFRLIRFHKTGMVSDHNDNPCFEGLPTTFSGGLLCFIIYFMHDTFLATWVLVAMLALSALMVSRLKIRRLSFSQS